jgi:hypothetical protein
MEGLSPRVAQVEEMNCDNAGRAAKCRPTHYGHKNKSNMNFKGFYGIYDALRKDESQNSSESGEVSSKIKRRHNTKTIAYYGYSKVNQFYKILKSSALITATTNIIFITRLCYVK